MAQAIGLKVVQSKYSDTSTKGAIYYKSASDGTAMFINDPVKTADTNVDSTARYPTVTPAGSATAIRGVMVGYIPFAITGNSNTVYSPASTAAMVIVDDDPNAVFMATEDAIGGALTTTQMSTTVDLISGAGSTTTGLSGYLIDSSTAGTSTGTFLLQGIASVVGNAITADTLNGSASAFLLTANKHELKSTAGV